MDPATGFEKRQGIVRIFALLGPLAAEAVPDLARLVRAGGWLGIVAANALGDLGDVAIAAVPAMIAALDNSDDRGRIIEALGKIGSSSTQSVLPTLMSALHAEDTRLEAIKALQRFGSAAEAALPILMHVLKSDEDREFRASAAEAIAVIGMGKTVVIQDLIQALQDPDRHVRYAALSALGVLGPLGTPAIPALRMLATRDRDAEIVRRALVSIGKLINLHASDYCSALIAALQDDDHGIRIEAARALVDSGTEGSLAVPALIASLQDEDTGVRLWATRALGRLRSEAATVPLRALLNDDNQLVRDTAASVLGSLGYR